MKTTDIQEYRKKYYIDNKNKLNEYAKKYYHTYKKNNTIKTKKNNKSIQIISQYKYFPNGIIVDLNI